MQYEKVEIDCNYEKWNILYRSACVVYFYILISMICLILFHRPLKSSLS